MHACAECGRITANRRCPAHQRTPLAQGGTTATGWGKRDRSAQARFRAMLIARDGLRCNDCGAHDIPLQAHHDTATDGRLLCSACHKEADDHAR